MSIEEKTKTPILIFEEQEWANFVEDYTFRNECNFPSSIGTVIGIVNEESKAKAKSEAYQSLRENAEKIGANIVKLEEEKHRGIIRHTVSIKGTAYKGNLEKYVNLEEYDLVARVNEEKTSLEKTEKKYKELQETALISGLGIVALSVVAGGICLPVGIVLAAGGVAITGSSIAIGVIGKKFPYKLTKSIDKLVHKSYKPAEFAKKGWDLI